MTHSVSMHFLAEILMFLLMMFQVWIWFHVLSEGQERFCAMFAPTIVRMWYFCCILVYLPVIIQNHFPTLLIVSSQTSRAQRKLLYSPQQSLTHCYIQYIHPSYQSEYVLISYYFLCKQQSKLVKVGNYTDVHLLQNQQSITFSISIVRGSLHTRQQHRWMEFEEQLYFFTSSPLMGQYLA